MLGELYSHNRVDFTRIKLIEISTFTKFQILVFRFKKMNKNKLAWKGRGQYEYLLNG